MFQPNNKLAAKQFCIKGHDTYIVGRTGRSSCKQCKRDWALNHKADSKIWAKRYYNSDKSKENAWKRKGINLTLIEYNNLFLIQQGCCAICKIHQTELKKKLCVDHCHTTFQIRGLLCDACNTSLGRLQENISTLKTMISYLERWGDK